MVLFCYKKTQNDKKKSLREFDSTRSSNFYFVFQQKLSTYISNMSYIEAIPFILTPKYD